MTSMITRAMRRGSQSIRSAVLIGFADYLGYPRWAVRTRLGSRPPLYQNATEEVGATEYSQSAFKHYRPLARVRWPLFLLASIPGQMEGRLLVIGPRFESEFYLARGLGWSRESVVGLDLLSYSPYVTTGDMHAMPFADEEFRSIVCGWTISYSLRTEVAAQEMSRVLAPGGIVVFGLEVARDDSASDLGVPKGPNRIHTRSQFEALLRGFDGVACFAPEGDGNLIIAMRKPLK